MKKIRITVERTSPKQGIDYTLILSRRKTASIRVLPSGQVLFMAPRNIPLTYADEIIDHRSSWISKRKLDSETKIAIPPCAPEDKKIFAARVRQKASEILLKYNGKLPKRVFIRFSRTSWGSCSTLGNISLSGYLCHLPDELFEYVVLHELCHLYHMNHSAEFWSLLDRLLPEPKLLRKKLGRYILPR
ncbi:MAG: M48 family metallopeptidase [Oscillospiraceae bacterium]|nr:M48 family metallopeptidase [Oscillospiraceae bacterium]